MEVHFQQRINAVADWIVLNTAGFPYIMGVCAASWTSAIRRKYPQNVLVTFFGLHFMKGGEVAQFFADRNEYYAAGEKLFNNVQSIQQIYDDFERVEKELVEYMDHVEKEGTTYLYDQYPQFLDLYTQMWTIGAIPDGILVYSDDLLVGLRKAYPMYQREIDILVLPYGQTFFVRNKLSLLEMAIKAKKENISAEELMISSLTDELQVHQRDFFWIYNSYWKLDPLPVEYFARQVGELLKEDASTLEARLAVLLREVTVHRQEVAEIERRGIFSEEDFAKLFWIGKTAWWMDRRKEYNIRGNYYLGQYVRHLCEERDWRYEDAVSLFPWELERVLKGERQLDEYLLPQRQEECLLLYTIDDEQEVLCAEEATLLWQHVIGVEHAGEEKEITGQVACSGIVRGIARIVLNSQNIEEFNEGDILVTGMTRPDFLGFMAKAAAFVTDEGGVTCHAAIVAREFKKPCIIGTKHATRRIKNGQLIEVDANRGTVTLL